MNEKAQKTVEAAKSQMGNPYVFGAWGSECTPSMRRKYQGYNPSHAAAIAKKCPVLSGTASNCNGCKWQGKLAFDCRGFTYWVLKQVDIHISGGGATSQYNTASNWAQRGDISAMPDLPCCVFKDDGTGTKQHTGYHIGGGDIIHCSAGVQTGKVTDKGWTHYAIPVGLYTQDELAAAGIVSVRATLRRGSKGEAVRDLQEQLNNLAYALEVDGIFGSATLAAVKDFQQLSGLQVDGIVGAKTWAALEAHSDVSSTPSKPAEQKRYTVTISGLDNTTVAYLLDHYATATCVEETAAAQA